jgi:ATP phosphoribosyltransferase regulatory subunit
MAFLPPSLFDQLADELAACQTIIRQLQTPLDEFGYDLVDTPLIEQADLFLIKAGDAAINRLVTFDLPGRTLCLRPEFTVPAARLYIEHFQDRPGAVRLQFAGPIVQYERLGHSHIWQQNAVGAELLNERGPAADAEIIALAGKMLDAVGVCRWRLIIGHSGLVGRFLDRYDLNRQMRRLVLEQLPILRTGPEGYAQARAAIIDSQPLLANDVSLAPTNGWHPDAETALQALLQATPQRGPSGGRTREEIARRLLSKQQQTDQRAGALAALEDFRAIVERFRTPAEVARAVDDPALRTIATELADTFERLVGYGLPAGRIGFDLTFTRNLDYYTGIVFEYRTPPDAGDLLLTGGGRYDELIRLLGARRDVPAVGLMTYVERLRQVKEGQP